MQKKFIDSVKNGALLLAVLTLLAACGGGEEEVPAVPSDTPAPTTPTTPTPAPPAPQGLGGTFETKSPGTPLAQLQDPSAAYQALIGNLLGYGSATVQTITSFDYSVTGYFPNAVWTQLTQPTQQNVQIPTYQIWGSYDSPYYGSPANGNLILQMYSRYTGTRYYAFVFRVRVGGIQLDSTDQVALFQSLDSSEILKVGYTTTNPTIHSYLVEQVWSGFGGFGPNQYDPNFSSTDRYLVTQTIFSTSLQYQQNNVPVANNGSGAPNDYNPYYY